MALRSPSPDALRDIRSMYPKSKYGRVEGLGPLFGVVAHVSSVRAPVSAPLVPVRPQRPSAPASWWCGPPSGMLGVYALLTFGPPARPGGHRRPGRLPRKDLA